MRIRRTSEDTGFDQRSRETGIISVLSRRSLFDFGSGATSTGQQVFPVSGEEE